jgi:hypothetical protein
MKKHILITILLSIVLLAYTQDNKFSFRMGMDTYPPVSSSTNFLPVGNIELNYSISNYFELGVKSGFSYSLVLASFKDGKLGLSSLYGDLHCRYYFLNHIIKNPDPKITLYAKAKVGAYKMLVTEKFREEFFDRTGFSFPEKTKSIKEYGAYVGAKWKWSKRLSIFAETGYGNKNRNSIGLCFSFQ